MSGSAARAISGYEVEGEIAQGGMGVVYLARQPLLDRRVVLKTLRRDLAGDPGLVERFEREARSAASVQHQNVVAVYDCFSWRGTRYIAQEYVEGLDLASVLCAAQRLGPRVAALVALEIARGLEEIHERGVVHRDLKPSNVLIGRGGVVKIADFGIALEPRGAALTETGHAVGTPLYMSPEQLLGERVDARSDLFSLGALLYEMLVGRAPYAEDDGGEEAGLVRRIEAERYPSARRLARGTPWPLARLVRRCLRAKPGRRPASATAVRETLERHLEHPPPATCRAEIAGHLWSRRIFTAEEGATEPRAAVARHGAPRWRRAAWAAALAGGLAAGALLADRAGIDIELRWPTAREVSQLITPLSGLE